MRELIVPEPAKKTDFPFNIFSWQSRIDTVDKLPKNKENLEKAFRAFRLHTEALKVTPDITLEDIFNKEEEDFFIMVYRRCFEEFLKNWSDFTFEKVKKALVDQLKEDHLEESKIYNIAYYLLNGILKGNRSSALRFIKDALQQFYMQKHEDLSWLQEEYIKLADEFVETYGDELSFYLESYVEEAAVPVLEKIVPYIEDKRRRAQVIYAISKFKGEDPEIEEEDED